MKSIPKLSVTFENTSTWDSHSIKPFIYVLAPYPVRHCMGFPLFPFPGFLSCFLSKSEGVQYRVNLSLIPVFFWLECVVYIGMKARNCVNQELMLGAHLGKKGNQVSLHSSVSASCCFAICQYQHRCTKSPRSHTYQQHRAVGWLTPNNCFKWTLHADHF